jgi:hypothetical protein
VRPDERDFESTSVRKLGREKLAHVCHWLAINKLSPESISRRKADSLALG